MPKVILPPLPWPGTTNTHYRHVGHKVLLSARGRSYRNQVIEILLIHPGWATLKGPLKVTAVFHRPDLCRRDLDNLQKSLYDSLKHAGVYQDDSQIEHLDVRFAPLPLTDKRGTVEITLSPLKTSKKPRKPSK